MSLPSAIRVKISSEAAGSISLTPVVVRDMPLRELIETMLGVMGKDPVRVRESFARGTLVSGASRFRWEGWNPDAAALEEVLRTFPDAEPNRAFEPALCAKAVFRAASLRVEIARETAAKRRLFHRMSFWDALMLFADGSKPRYIGYSYRDRADRYRIPLEPSVLAGLLEHVRLLRYSQLAAQLRSFPAEDIEFEVDRPEISPST